MTNKRPFEMRTRTLSFGTSLAQRAILGLIVGAAMGCSAADSGTTPGSGGATGSGGTSASGGSSGTGGSSASGGSSGTGGKTASGGAPGTGGSTGSGGASASGGSGTSSGGAGATGGSHGGGTNGGGGRAAGSGGSGGPGGSGMGTGGSGPAGTPKPSAGCSKMTPRPSGGQVSVANEKLHIFPASYDGTKPFPLIIALHACGNPNTEFVNQFKGTGFDTEYVQTYPNTPDGSGQCWSNYNADIMRVLAQYDELMSTYCIDQNRVFATAHSSGAQLLVNILAHKTDAQHLNFKAVSPVAGGTFSVALPIPVLYIDGINDTERKSDPAKNVVAKFVSANMCKSTSMPYTAIAGCKSIQNGAAVDPGCIIYDGCSVPTIWCSHNDPNYSNTEHGIPCFAMKSMYDFFKGLP
jgi:polyhydroxybutyrate depolymerase